MSEAEYLLCILYLPLKWSGGIQKLVSLILSLW